jgi:hypothetical protein
MRDQNMAMGESGFFSVCRNMFKLEYADKLFLLIHMVLLVCVVWIELYYTIIWLCYIDGSC